MSEKNIIIMRHFETFEDSNGNEKINYEKSLDKSENFINFIKEYIEKNKNISRIRFYTSKHERTIISALIMCNKLKSNIILNKLGPIDIYDPIITDLIDRDPQKKKYKNNCIKIKNEIDAKFKSDTLYIFVTHSSTIYNLFECFFKLYSSKYNEKFVNKIHSYSLSFLTKKKKNLIFDFNINMR